MKLEKLECPKCKSSDIFIKAGMFTDLYTCKKCNYEWRS